MTLLDKIRAFLRAHPWIVVDAEQLEAAALQTLGNDAEAAVETLFPILGALAKPIVTGLVNKAIAEVDADTAKALSTWINAQPGFVIAGDGRAGIIEMEEIDTPAAKKE